jgi:D-glycero-D-manno-heptose 1,7-bisphosphate phosphatase
VLPKLAAAGRVRGTIGHGFFVDIGIQADLDIARHELTAIVARPALFLDRDGVINHDHGYVGTHDRFDWVDGALDAIRLATTHGWHVFVVSNQSGVARGLYTEADVASLMSWIIDEARRHGGTIDDYRTCPYLIDATIPAYRRDSDWRKPAPGMILHLAGSWNLNLQHCVMVGDQSTDLECARRAKIRGHIFPGGNLAAFIAPIVAASPQDGPEPAA